MKTYTGGCHCERVMFEVQGPEAIEAHRCNCSMCSMTGFVHLIVPKTQFRLVKGQENITTYTFNTGVAQHYFCNTCGVKPYYVPRSNPDGISVNVNCLRLEQDQDLTVIPFDGQNWEKNAGDLEHLA